MSITRDEAIRVAGLVLAELRAERDSLGPREAAEAAWYRGHPMSVDEIEALIISQRAEAVAAAQAAGHIRAGEKWKDAVTAEIGP